METICESNVYHVTFTPLGMTKRIIILISFLAYSLTFIHSVVPHHHHEIKTAKHQHSETNDHNHSDHENKTVNHAFADAVHVPGSEVVIHSGQTEVTVKFSQVAELRTDNLLDLLSPQLKPPDLNADRRQVFIHQHIIHYYCCGLLL
ncbi:MAG: hypothetical protein HWD62_14620 [Cyclobacteriaceae bacterium]|nr:MAG: hypothetical protein HWD62_14620 [Cyclobacteriaceae bacterium]